MNAVSSADSGPSAPRVGVVGAAGYTGEVLLTLLARHPRLQLTVATSRQFAGKSLAESVPALGATPAGALAFENLTPGQLAERSLETCFLALPHGAAAEYALALVEAGVQVIDLSADFRLTSPARYEEFYGQPHPAPEWLARAPYVLPELAAAGWEEAPLIACPGCYPTSVLLALVPLLRAGLAATEGIKIFSTSGVSGAGRKADLAYAFCERNESVRAYGIPKHRHLSEIEEQLSLAAGSDVVVQFLPHLVPLTQGIATTIVLPSEASAEAVRGCWRSAYEGRGFVRILEADRFPDTRHVAGTNLAQLRVTADPRTGSLVLNTAIDNLMKGASGQAVQLANCRYGWDETLGLI